MTTRLLSVRAPWVVAVVGAILCGGLFLLVRQEVQYFVAEQLTRQTSRALAPAQARLDDAEEILRGLDALFGLQGEWPAEVLSRFAGHWADEGLAAQFYLLRWQDGVPVELQNLTSAPIAGFRVQYLLSYPLADLLARAQRDGIATAVMPASAEREALLLMIGRTGPAIEGRVTIGVFALAGLLADLPRQLDDGPLSSLQLRDAASQTVPPIISLRETRPDPMALLGDVLVHDRLRLPDRWLIADFRGVPQDHALFLLLVPWLVLVVGLTLTVSSVWYLLSSGARGREVESLATSLAQSNAELQRRVLETDTLTEQLRASEIQYRSIFENAGIGIGQINPAGAFVSANPAMASILGYRQAADLLTAGAGALRFAQEEQARQWQERLQQGRSTRDWIVQLRRADGQLVWASITGQRVRDSALLECTLLDVTEREQARQELILAKEQADFASRSKSEFLANMSHELRTPLNAIIGFAEIIKDELFGKVGQPQYREYAADIYDSGNLLLSLINDILDMAKVEAGKRALAEEVVDLTSVITACTRLIAARAKAGRVRLQTSLAPGLPKLRAEERALKQILNNLLANAVKFTPEGGSVSLSAAQLADGRLQLTVADTGIGIAPEDIPIALAPFGQIESALSRKHAGSGLGLPLTKALVELHDGELTITSARERGTTVTVTLPAARVIAS